MNVATRIRGHRIITAVLDGEPTACGALHLTMPPPSLNNLFINAKRKGRIKSPDYRAWQVTALLQIRRQHGWHVPSRVHVRLTFNRADTRADLDNLIKPTLDLLVSAGRISDDRNVMKLEAEFASGAHGTRIEISAWPPMSRPQKNPDSARAEGLSHPESICGSLRSRSPASERSAQ